MNIVRFAMHRPVAVIVAVIAVIIVGCLAIDHMQRDIFPDLDQPQMYVLQPYGGLSAVDVLRFATTYYERNLLYVPGVSSVDTKSRSGLCMVDIKFRPGTDMAEATSDVIAAAERSRANMPKGTSPPLIVRYDQGGMPIGDLVFSSSTLPLGRLQDLVESRIDPLYARLKGVAATIPFGVARRTIVVSINPNKLRSFGLSPQQVAQAIASSDVLAPEGNVHLGTRLDAVLTNALIPRIQQIADIPIRLGTLQTVYVGEIGSVSDSTDINTGYALVDGRKSVYLPVVKRADASTLTVANLVRASLPKFRAVMPHSVTVAYRFDQSPHVTQAITEVTVETVLGALLTGLVVLVFLRDWRSAVIVLMTIPISLLASCAALWACGQTLNLMSLGGLALAVGMLVDESIVVVENIRTRQSTIQSRTLAVLNGAWEVNLPRLVAMLCLLAVFVPSFFMHGTPRALFVPLSMAIGFAMIASYLTSSMFVPILAVWIGVGHGHVATAKNKSALNLLGEKYATVVRCLERQRWNVALTCLAIVASGLVWMIPRIGVRIFPRADSGQLEIRLAEPPGTYFTQTTKTAQAVLREVRRLASPGNEAGSLGYAGTQPGSKAINNIYVWTSGPEDAVLQVQLRGSARTRGVQFLRQLRHALNRRFPDVAFSIEPDSIVDRAMNFGSPTPVDIQIAGPSLDRDYLYARNVFKVLAKLPDLAGLRITPTLDYPVVHVDIRRQIAGAMGYSVQKVSDALISATASTRRYIRIFWSDPATQLAYHVQIEVPRPLMNNIENVKSIPIGSHHGVPILLRQVARITPGTTPELYDRINGQPTISVIADVSGENLGAASRQVGAALASLPPPPRGVSVHVAGQIAALSNILHGLSGGLIVALLAILLFLTANFESPRLAITTISTAPFVLLGVATMLVLTGTTLNLQSYMGTIMALGIAMANAILVVAFAERARIRGLDAGDAAVEGGRTRLRPVLMTSTAMIAGMVPMALGVGEGGHEAAPLGRAVIGGLLGATFATLFILPAIFAIVQENRPREPSSLLQRYEDKNGEPSN
ncbi:MAG: efflux RND transporter permease subunit [Phycisphaerae bacterium]